MKLRKRKLKLLWNAGYRRMIPRRLKFLVILPPMDFWKDIVVGDERDILGEAETAAVIELMQEEDRLWREAVNKEATNEAV